MRTVLPSALLVLLSGCTVAFGAGMPTRTPSRAIVPSRGAFERCARGLVDDELRQPLAGPEEDPALAAELDSMPPAVRRTALAAGLEPILARMLHEHDAAGGADPRYVARRQAVALQLASLSTQLDATVFEADCVGDRVESLRLGIERRENAQEIRRTVSSIVVGAAAGVAAGVWELTDDESKGPAAVALVGGALGGGLGVAAFVSRPHPILLEHHRNLLTPVVRGDDPDHVLPTFVLRMLTLPTEEGATPREVLIRRFAGILEHAVDADERGRAEDLIYGEGGVYDVRILEAREHALDELESTLSAFARDLELLQRWLARTFDEGFLLDAPT